MYFLYLETYVLSLDKANWLGRLFFKQRRSHS
jgi:hypothetical protein